MRKIQLYFIAILLLAAQSVFSQGINTLPDEIVNIENDGVKKYLDDDTYDTPTGVSNYNLSVVQKYSANSSSRPNGKYVKWQRYRPLEEIVCVIATISENPNFKGERTKKYLLNPSDTEYTICNMIPERVYYYKIEEFSFDGEMVVAKGSFMATGRLRMLKVDGMFNIRDFGGWKTSLGGRTSYGRIYRGNRPDGITIKGREEFVENECLTADLDLRGKPMSASPFGLQRDGKTPVEYFCTNNARYKLALVARNDIFAKDFHFIADVLSRGGSVFLHCNHGANRAGTLSFLIDGIIGLSEADISRDYELSSFAYKGMRRGTNIGDMISYIRSFGNTGDDLAQCFYNYLIQIGVAKKDIENIRKAMVNK